jgi:hypothetical protein
MNPARSTQSSPAGSRPAPERALSYSGTQRASILLCSALLVVALALPAVAQAIRPDFYETNGPVSALILSGNTLYIGGEFTEVRPAAGGASATRHRLAALDVKSGALLPWNPGADGGVTALAVSGTTVYAGGGFQNVGGQPRAYLAALDATTGQVTAWDAGGVEDIHDVGIYALAATPTTVYVGGAFYSIAYQFRDGLAALDATTGQVTAWNPTVGGEDNALVVSGNLVYAGGSLQIADGTRPNIGAVEAASGAVAPWNPEANFRVMTLGLNGNTVYAGGLFSMIGGMPRNRIAALNKTSGLATPWNPDANSWVWQLAVSGPAVYVGGNFTRIGGATRNHLAAIDPVSGLATGWDPDINGDVRALAVGGGGIYAGGEFTRVGGITRNYLAAWDLDVTDVPAGGPRAGLELEGAPNPFRAAAQIRYRLPQATVASLGLFDVSGRRVATLVNGRSEPAGWHEVRLDGRALANGIYFVKLDAGAESRTMKVLRVE